MLLVAAAQGAQVPLHPMADGLHVAPELSIHPFQATSLQVRIERIKALEGRHPHQEVWALVPHVDAGRRPVSWPRPAWYCRRGCSGALRPESEGLGGLGRIGPHEATVAVGQIQDESVGFPLHAADDHQRLAKVALGMARRMGQRDEHLPSITTTLPQFGRFLARNRFAEGKATKLSSVQAGRHE